MIFNDLRYKDEINLQGFRDFFGPTCKMAKKLQKEPD